MKKAAAEIIREYGPFPGSDRVNGVSYDGEQVWFADGAKLNAFDPNSGKILRSIDVLSYEFPTQVELPETLVCGRFPG